MQITKLVLITTTILIIESCHTSKKTTTSTASTPAATTTTASTPTVTTSGPNLFVKPENGVYAPGAEELLALQAKYAQYKDATLDQLKAGHKLYTETACLNCHGAKNIYRHEAIDWVRIIDDMAMRARLNAEEKDAVFKYVISIKSAQGK